MSVATRHRVAVLIAFATGFTLCAVVADDDGPRTTTAAMRAVNKLFPDGRIDEVEFERKIVQLYDITVVSDGKAREVSVMPDGTVLNVEREIKIAEAPPKVVEALQKMAGGDGRITEIEHVEVHSELRPLDRPRVMYEAEIKIGGRERLVQLTEDGEPIDRNGADPADDE